MLKIVKNIKVKVIIQMFCVYVDRKEDKLNA